MKKILTLLMLAALLAPAADGQKSVENIGDAKELLKNFRQEDWNTYRVVCRGEVIELFAAKA
jgi:hypothetical protein